jgi:hypothetical protein
MMEGFVMQQWNKEPIREMGDTSWSEREFNKAVR